MPRVTVITDSTADVPAAMAQQLGLIVVPARYQIGKKSHTDYLTARAQSAHSWFPAKGPLAVAPPSAIVLQELYAKLSAEGRSIVSIQRRVFSTGTAVSASPCVTMTGIVSLIGVSIGDAFACMLNAAGAMAAIAAQFDAYFTPRWSVPAPPIE